jgi:hypothetical protein
LAHRGSLASHLIAATKQFRKRRLTHIRESFSHEEADTAIRMVERMARDLFDAGHAVVREPRTRAAVISKENIEEQMAGLLAERLLKPTRKPGRLRGWLELAIAQSFSLHTDEMSERCLALARIALPQRPGPAVNRYLQRLGRCYVAGFDPETVIVCRAVLENAVNDKFHREHKPVPIPSAGRSEMRAKLIKAEDLGWLTRREHEDAWAVWDRGSTAAHRDPQVTTAVLETIETTIRLLNTLYRPGTRSAA